MADITDEKILSVTAVATLVISLEEAKREREEKDGGERVRAWLNIHR